MKKLMFMGMLSVVSLSASARVDDGCYQMYRTGTLFPALCIAGTFEEGINGSGVRVVVVKTGTNKVEWCQSTTSMDINEGKTIFKFKDSIIVMDGNENGTVTIGKTQLSYSKIPAVYSQKGGALADVFSSPLCQ